MKKMRTLVVGGLLRTVKDETQAVTKSATTAERAVTIIWLKTGGVSSSGRLWENIGHPMASVVSLVWMLADSMC